MERCLTKDSKKVRMVQELVYELRVGSVITSDVITVDPETGMSELRKILKDNRIPGTPVTENNELVGIVSVEDFINWLAEGASDCPVRERMTTEVKILFEDEFLINAVSKLEHYGFGRFPVLNRETRRLKGVLTKGDIVEGLYKELEKGYTEEEIHRYRASHFFEDIIADSATITLNHRVGNKKIEEGGEVASNIKKTLKRLGVHPGIVRRAAISAYEAEMNLIIYAKGGEFLVKVDPCRVYMEVSDKGPGIPDIQQVLQPGYSTAPDWVRELGFGAGMGLNNIQNCAGSLDILSEVDRGTCLKN